MTDPYAKTLVIRDEDYQPGEVHPKDRTAPSAQDSPQAFDEQEVPMDYPSYEDTSWLT